MAEKKKKQKNTFQKPEVADFHKKENSGFQKGGSAVFQARDGNTQKAAPEFEQGKNLSKSHAKKAHQDTFGQNVQKSDVEPGKGETFDFIRNENTFWELEKEVVETQTGRISKNQSKKAYQDTFGQNVQKLDAETEKKTTSDFIKNENVFSEQAKEVAKTQSNRASKTRAKKMYQKTFGQNVQKSDTEPEKKETFDFIKNENVFSEQDFTEQQEKTEQKQNFTAQYEKTEPKQSFAKNYQQRDTYKQSAKKRKYHRKRVKKEHQSKQSEDIGKGVGDFQTKDTTFTENTDSPFVESKKLQKKRKQAQKAGEKTEKARAKLPKKKEYTLQRVYDEETGRGRYVVVPIEKEKTFKPDGFPKSAMKRLENEGKNFVHGKIAENEKENSAVEAAHKTEQKVEDFYGFVKRQYKGKAQRQRAKVAKLEKKQFQKEVNFQYQKFLEENPQMKKKALQKRLQKQRIKREYMKAKRNGAATKSAKKAVAKTADTTAKVARKLLEIARNHAGVFLTAGVIVLLLIMIMTSVSSCGAMFAGTQSTIMAASYMSEPKEIDAADLQFTRLELDLQNEIDNIETDYPGYDEYSYNLGAIGHNPFTLISYLSAVYTEFTASEVENEVQELFEEMYTLTITPETETRTRQVQATDEEGNPLYDENGNPVMTEEEYEVSVLRVVLTVKPLETIVTERMNTEQKEVFAMYSETGGLLQQFASPLDLYWYNYISSYYGYRKNPNTGNEELHRGVDIAVPTGTKVYAAHDGTVTTATYDSYYGNYVVVEKDGYTTKYAHMDSLSVSAGQEVTKGTVIGTTGNTGSSSGSHLHIECLYNGEYYNPLFYFDVGTKTLYGENTGGGTTGGGNGGNVIPPNSYDDATVQTLMEEAAKYLGYPYVWGGSSPSTSFDCSGFVCWVFTNSGVHNLPRTTAQGIYDQCTPVSASEAKAGDIIFFTGTYNSAGAVSHVGIYCGDGVMIHCGDPISYASINSPYWQSHFYSFGRLN
ncbi:MAG: peptidoglycan DD-metalloendopeptidase family protein [Lachnospiraceae bacterium]|nr:peptidoglycan DD-metalloendopeptidase family protein [Lachnospiraceae bacterium]